MFDFARIIGFALATYPLVFIIFFPALWFAHRQLGKPFGRKRITILFLLGLSIYGPLLLTNLPLPDDFTAFCESTGGLKPRLEPFQFIPPAKYFLSELVRKGVILNIPFLWESFLNFWMLFPAGVIFRVLKKRNILMPIMIAVASSLLLEMTQLTGIWGLIGCAHRTFDVDDIILNSSGFLAGWIAMSILFAISAWYSRRVKSNV